MLRAITTLGGALVKSAGGERVRVRCWTGTDSCR